MKKLIEVNSPEQMASGLWPDVPANQQLIWKEGNNILFEDGKIKKLRGWDPVVTPTGNDTVHAIEQAYTSGVKRVYYATASKVYIWYDGVIQRIGTGYTGVGDWSMVTWGTWLIFTNGLEPVQVWKNNAASPDTATALSGVVLTPADIVRKHSNHVLLYKDTTAAWCSASDPETWTATSANSAGSMVIRDLDSTIMNVTRLGEDYAIYSNDSMVIQRYIGGNFIFSFTEAINGIGAVGKNSVVGVGTFNYGLSRKGVFRTDGVTFQYIDPPGYKTWIADKINFNDAYLTVALHWESRKMVCFWFEGSDSETHGVGYNYEKGIWTTLDIPVTAAAENQVLADKVLVGMATSAGYLTAPCWGYFDTGYNAGDDALLTGVKTFPLNAGDRERFKQWDMLRVDYTTDDGSTPVGAELEVRFGFNERPGDEPEWTEWEVVTDENYIGRDSPHITVEFRSIDMDSYYELHGFSLHGVMGGYL